MLENEALRFFTQLEGTWVLERTLGDQGKMKGMASFAMKEPYLYHYREQGTSNFRGRLFTSFRAYLYRYKDGQVLVQYWDPHKKGDLLYTLNFREKGIAVGEHLCECDMYSVKYELLEEEQLRITSRVQGPKKAYILRDVLVKCR